MTATKEHNPTALDHERARKMLGHDTHRPLTEADTNRLGLVLDDLHFDGCITETATRRISVVADGGHLTAVMAIACIETDANRLSARGLAEILLVLTTGKMPR